VENIEAFEAILQLSFDLPRKNSAISAEEALTYTYLKVSSYPIPASILPTLPAKSEFHGQCKTQSPKPPSGGRAFKQLGTTMMSLMLIPTLDSTWMVQSWTDPVGANY